MFVQATTSSRKHGKTNLSYLVRGSFRTAPGPRSRTGCNITELPAHTRDLVVASLNGQNFQSADQVQLHEALDYGGLTVLNDAGSFYHLAELFANIGSTRQQGLLQAIIYSRLLFPRAKLSLGHQAQGTWLAQACGLDPTESFAEDDLYAAMDQHSGHPARRPGTVRRDARLAGVAREIQSGRAPEEWLRRGVEVGTKATQMPVGQLE
jgi:hypothetical protein